MIKFDLAINRKRKKFLGDSLYRNSIYLMGSTLVVSIFGFLYWAIAAHLYSTRSVGLVATLVAISNVVMVLSLFGYDNSFIRFLPKAKNYAEQLDTGFVISSIASIVIGLIFLFGIKLFIPKLDFVDSSLLWSGFFIFFMLVNMLNYLSNYPFIAYRITHVILIINTGMGIARLILLFALKHFGFTGLLVSQVMSLFLALVVTFCFMKIKIDYWPRVRIVKQELKRVAAYTAQSYLSIIFLTIPTYILPVLIVGKLGASNAAYYYIVAVIIAGLNVIPMAISQALFAEGSWDDTRISKHLIRATKAIFILTIPAVLILIIVGKPVLSIFGRGYSESGYLLLVVLAISGVPKALSYALSAILRIEHQVSKVALIYLVYALIIVIGSYLGIRSGHTLITVGWFTLLAEIVTAMFFVIAFMNRPKKNQLN